MNTVFELIGCLAGICTAVCFLPQTIKTIRLPDVKGLSVVSYIIYNIGILCWIIYGYYLGSIQMIFFNVISIIFAFTILCLIIKYKNKKIPCKPFRK